MNKYIWITTQKEILHQYNNAPDEVSFLRNKHRHILHLKVFIEIFDNDRDIEFIMFKRQINYMLKDVYDINNYSLEMFSDWLKKQIQKVYKNRKIKIELSEDNENGMQFEY